MIVDVLKQLYNRMYHEIFFTDVPQVGIFHYYVFHC